MKTPTEIKKSLPRNWKLRVRHYYGERMAEFPFRKQRTKYATHAVVINRETGEVMGDDWAICSPRDVPNRRIGFNVAAGRAIKQAHFFNEMNQMPLDL